MDRDDVSVLATAAAVLEAPRVTEANGNKLDPATDPTTVEIPVYTGKALDDLVTVNWRGRSAAASFSDALRVSASAVARVQRFSVPGTVILAGEGGTVSATYTVTRRNGVTDTSRTLTLQIGEPAPEPGLVDPPVIDGVVGGVLNLESVPAQGASATIRPYAGMARFDVVFINVDNARWEDAKRIELPTDVNQPVRFTIPREVLASVSGREVVVKTQVMLANGTLIHSNDSRIRVLEPVGALPAVEVPQAQSQTIDPVTLNTPTVQVRVRPYPGIATGDVVELTWTNASGAPAPFVARSTVGATPQDDIVFEVPRIHVDQNVDRSASIAYAVVRGTAMPVRSAAYLLYVGAPFDAPATIDLAVHGYVIGERPPLAPPDFAMLTREARFGTAPYTYRSDDTTVAQIDANGRVTATGNGTTRITATDRLGQSRSFTLTVRGARQMFFVSGNATQAGARTACAAAGLVLPSVDEIQAFWRTYFPSSGPVGRHMGWLSYHFWTSTPLDAATAVTYDLSGGSEERNVGGRRLTDRLQVVGITPP